MRREDLIVCEGVEFYPLTHEYVTEGGVYLKGVTTLMKEQGLGRSSLTTIPQDILDKAAERGTAIHAALQDYDDGKEVILTPDVKAYRKALDAAGLQVIASEWLVSNHTTVASMIDKVLADGSLADVKTYASFDAEAKAAASWQLSIYAYLFEKAQGIAVPNLYVFHVRDGKCKVISVPRHPREEVERLLACDAMGVIYEPEAEVLPEGKEQQLVLLADIERQLVEASVIVDALKVKEAEARKALYELLDDGESHEVEGWRFTKIAPTVREGVDTAKLKAEYEEVYEACKKYTNVAGTIKVTQKKSK